MSAVAEFGDYISPEEYLLTENDRDDGIKHEYLNGQVYAMAGASRNHNRVAGNLFLSLGAHLKNSQCEVFQSDMKVSIKSLNDQRYYYPDLQVSCTEEDNKYYNTAPCLIIEVLSESTSRTDRTEKLEAYKSLASLQEYVLCSQDSPFIEVYRRNKDWQKEVFTLGQSCFLESVELEILVDDIYGFLLS